VSVFSTQLPPAREILDTHAHILPSSLKFQEKDDDTHSEDGYTQLTTMTFCNTQTAYEEFRNRNFSSLQHRKT